MIRNYKKNCYWSVYKIQNSVNGKCYIGITTKTLNQRLWEHVRDANAGKRYALHYAIRKYGAEKFTVSLLARVNDLASAQALERDYIVEYQTIADGKRDGSGGYNMSFGGEVPDGY